MAFLYPIVILLIVNKSPYMLYVKEPGNAFSQLFSSFASLHVADIIVLISGLFGTIAAGIIMKLLRKAGYQMF